jgi:hypothetical protein
MSDQFAVFSTMLCAAALSSAPILQAQKDGFRVSIVQEPETSFHDDVTAVKRILALQD